MLGVIFLSRLKQALPHNRVPEIICGMTLPALILTRSGALIMVAGDCMRPTIKENRNGI
jgi:hypothetical protein